MKLSAENVTKEFIRKTGKSNHFSAVNDVSLTLESGRLTVLNGRSGSGKTTLLNMLSGLLSPTKGRITLDGEDIYALDDKRLSRLRNQRFGVIPQGQTAVHSLTVLENILLPFSLYRESGEAEQKYALELAGRLGIAQLCEVRPAELSGGELRRMAIARAVIRRPSVIFADEPTGDLDDENTALVFGFLRELSAQGSAVFIVTHENNAAGYADEVYRMNGGKLEISE